MTLFSEYRYTIVLIVVAENFKNSKLKKLLDLYTLPYK